MIKFFETHYDDYITSNSNITLQVNTNKIINDIMPSIQDISKLKNTIIYGPPGVGKYTSALKLIKKFSPSDLKYEKKINIVFNKQEYCFKISDIHYEIDMTLLGCNSKLLWNEIYLQIIDIISLKPEKSGIILCKYFNEIQIELLDNFYSYIQTNISSNNNINIKFIIITESITFIPDNILNTCNIIICPRPSKTAYKTLLNNNNNNYITKNNTKIKPSDIIEKIKLDNINNIKNLFCNIDNPIKHYENISNKLINEFILDKCRKKINFIKLREVIYDILIYNLNMNEIITNIIFTLTEKYTFTNTDFTKILIKTYKFFKYYNNNYRPIYHIELYIYHIIAIINKYDNKQCYNDDNKK
jgi:DNA polymerase III delta prime subunit